MKRYYLIIPLVVSAILLVIPYAIFSGNYIMYVSSDSMYPRPAYHTGGRVCFYNKLEK